jgi:hypothetical protein
VDAGAHRTTRSRLHGVLRGVASSAALGLRFVDRAAPTPGIRSRLNGFADSRERTGGECGPCVQIRSVRRGTMLRGWVALKVRRRAIARCSSAPGPPVRRRPSRWGAASRVRERLSAKLLSRERIPGRRAPRTQNSRPTTGAQNKSRPRGGGLVVVPPVVRRWRPVC